MSSTRTLVALSMLVASCSGSLGEGGGSNAGGGPSGGSNPRGGHPSTGPGAMSPEGPGPVVPGLPPFAPAPAQWMRLTEAQIANSLADVFGPGLQLPALDPDLREEGLAALGAGKVVTSATGVGRYAALADATADQLLADPMRRATWLPCPTPDKACVTGFVERAGRLLFRRPLEAGEVERYVGLWEKLSTMPASDGALALRHTISAMLQSPKFLYRLEQPGAGGTRYDAYSMASRLSFFLTDSTPDAALLDAAASGKLADVDGLRAAARRLLETPRARRATADFFVSLYGLGNLPRLALDEMLFPKMSATIGAAMQEETRRAVEAALADGGDFLALLESPTTFVNAELAALYGVPAPAGAGFAKVTLPADGPRAGILMHAGLLAASSSPNETSPMLRGKTIREAFLCQPIADPPPDVDDLPAAVPGEPPKSRREKLAVHREQPACNACHSQIDPPGLALEHFDALGVYRTEADGVPIDASGELDGIPFKDARGLAAAIRKHPATAECLVRKLYRQANGRHEGSGDEAVVARVVEAFASGGHKLADALLEIATSDGFTRAAPPSP